MNIKPLYDRVVIKRMEEEKMIVARRCWKTWPS